MKAKYIAFGILVVAIAITFSAIAVEADAPPEWNHADWLYDVGRHKIYQTNWILYNRIWPEILAIEAKLDDPVSGLKALNIDLDQIIDLTDDVEPYLKHGDFGLVAIDDEVEYIIDLLENPGFGLEEIKVEVMDIYDWLTTDANVVQDAELTSAKNEIFNAITAAMNTIIG